MLAPTDPHRGLASTLLLKCRLFLFCCVGSFAWLQRSWKLVPKQAGLLSAVEYSTRQIEFEVRVVAHIQQDRPEDEDEKVFKNPFEITFQVRKRRSRNRVPR